MEKEGILVFIHLDDGLGFASSKEKTAEASEKVRGDLISYGLLISENKCQWGARRMIEWTGFIWDTVNFKLLIPEKKLVKAEGAIDSLLAKAEKPVRIKELASVAGLIGSFNYAVGDHTRFYTRRMMMKIAKVTEEFSWSAKADLGEGVKEELRFWRLRLRDLNGHTIRKEDRVFNVQTRDFCSDAGGMQVGGAEFKGEESEVHCLKDSEFQAVIQEEDFGKSSTYRELLGIEEGLKVHGQHLQGQRVRWGCDNWAACQIVKIGSMKENCHEVARRIVELIRRWDIEFETYWLSRETLQIRHCDALSKDFDTADYRLSDADFRGLEDAFGPFDVDLFASSFSFLFKPFFARRACSMAAGVDAFSEDWGELGRVFIHPPVGLVVRVLRYAEQCRAKGLLVVPNWHSSIFMAKLVELEKRDKIRRVAKFKPFLHSAPWISSNTFQGFPWFDFLAFEMHF